MAVIAIKYHVNNQCYDAFYNVINSIACEYNIVYIAIIIIIYKWVSVRMKIKLQHNDNAG